MIPEVIRFCTIFDSSSILPQKYICQKQKYFGNISCKYSICSVFLDNCHENAVQCMLVIISYKSNGFVAANITKYKLYTKHRVINLICLLHRIFEIGSLNQMLSAPSTSGDMPFL